MDLLVDGRSSIGDSPAYRLALEVEEPALGRFKTRVAGFRDRLNKCLKLNQEFNQELQAF